jgi:hypothetical protein
MSVGRAYLLRNAEEYTPTVSQMMGASPAFFSKSAANPALNLAVESPAEYVGTYPVMLNDPDVIMYGVPRQNAYSLPPWVENP